MFSGTLRLLSRARLVNARTTAEDEGKDAQHPTLAREQRHWRMAASRAEARGADGP